MILVEIALQNAKTFPPKARLALRGGLNVLHVASSDQRSILVDAVYFALFPDPSRSSATEWFVEDPAQPARVALSVYGRDKKAYRILRDSRSGATRLHRFEPEKKRYELLTEVTTEAAQFIRVQQQLPDEVSFERLFVVAPDNRPSLGMRARSRSGTPVVADALGTGSFPSMSGITGSLTGDGFGAPPGAGGGWAAGAGTPPRGVSRAETFGSSLNMTNALVQSELEGGSAVEPAEARREDLLRELRNLERHIEVGKRAEVVQAELDQLQRRRADLVQRAEVLVRARAQADDLERELEQFDPRLAELSPKLDERLEAFEEAEARYRTDIDRLAQETQALGYASETLDLLALDRDPYFLGGIAVALVALLLAFLFDLPWVALFNLAGAAVAAGAAFRYVGDLENRERLETRSKATDERRARIEKQHELETAMVRRSMEKLEVEDHRELGRRVAEFTATRDRLEEAREAVQRAEADPQIMGAAEELESVNARIQELEPQVMGSAGSLQSVEQMERRIAVLRRELGAEASETSVPVIEGTADVGEPRPLLSDEDDSDDGYESGYGSTESPGEPGASMAGAWLAAASTGSGDGPSGPGRGYGGSYGGAGYDGGGLPPDRSRDLVQAGADLVQMDVEGLIESFKPRLLQYLSALSDGRLVACDFGPRGELSVEGRDGQARPYAQLGGEGLDLVDLALRLALVEGVVSRTRIPLLVDDVGTDFPPRRRKLFVQMLAHLSRLTQVVVLTPKSDLEGHAVSVEAVTK